MDDGLVILEFVGMVLVMVAAFLIMIPKRLGIWIMTISQVVWTIYAFQCGKHFLLFQSLFLIPVNIIALYQWRKRGIK